MVFFYLVDGILSFEFSMNLVTPMTQCSNSCLFTSVLHSGKCAHVKSQHSKCCLVVKSFEGYELILRVLWGLKYRFYLGFIYLNKIIKIKSNQIKQSFIIIIIIIIIIIYCARWCSFCFIYNYFNSL